MTRARIILYAVFGVYNLLVFIFTIVMEKSASLLFKLVGYVGAFKYITFIALCLFIADLIWLLMDLRKHKRQEESWRHENNVLKAKVYDLQEGAQPKPEVPKPN